MYSSSIKSPKKTVKKLKKKITRKEKKNHV